MPGPVNARPVTTARSTRGSSSPFSVAQILGQWTLAMAVNIEAMMPIEPSGLTSPSTNRSPPPNSARPTRVAHNPGGANPLWPYHASRSLEPRPAKPAKQLLRAMAHQQQADHEPNQEYPD